MNREGGVWALENIDRHSNLIYIYIYIVTCQVFVAFL
jgi:hypothetical protein